MRRTATHVLSSPNPAQLEMRILANHGADARFAFLKGRWARAWRLAKAHAQLARAKAQEKAQGKVGLGGLAGYGGSDSESGGEESTPEAGAALEDAAAEPDAVSVQLPAENIDTPDVVEDEIKAARRARAREWAEKRRHAPAASAPGT